MIAAIKNSTARCVVTFGTTMGKCQWRGFGGAGLACTSGCAEGETELVQDTNNHDKKKGDQNCNGGIQSYCCAGYKPSPSGKDLAKDAEDLAKSAAEVGVHI
jgi:chitinase